MTRISAKWGCTSKLASSAFFVAMGSGCTPAFDVVGSEETVLEKASQKSDSLSQKSPEYDPERTIEEVFEGCRMTLNKSASVTRLTLADLKREAPDLDGVLFATRAQALDALGERAAIASIEVVNGALKPFNDGLYAAIELAVERGGDGSLVDKRKVLNELLSALLDSSEASGDAAERAGVELGASLLLLGDDPGLGAERETAAREALARFEEGSFFSVPTGFYTWNAALEGIFRRDRFLQYVLGSENEGFDKARSASDALVENEALHRDYSRLLELYRGLSNPSRHFSPVDLADFIASAGQEVERGDFEAVHPELALHDPVCGSTYSWLPPSESPERKLLASDFCNSTPAENLLQRLIEAIQSGELDLTPKPDSGWYDWQLYALETLLVPEMAPENEHLLLTQAYKDKLVDTFKSLIIQTRETHVKQLEPIVTVVSAPPPPVDVYPLLPVEPFPTFYLRTARAYGFLKNLLEATLGSEAMTMLSRLREDGTHSDRSLSEELREKAELLYGLHWVAAASIGMADSLTHDERATLDLDAVERFARRWLLNWRVDEDVLVDPRVTVTLTTGPDGTRNLGVVGVRVMRMHASFPDGYEPEVERGLCELRHFVPYEPYLLVEQSLEFTRPPGASPLTREQFRARLAGLDDLQDMKNALERP